MINDDQSPKGEVSVYIACFQILKERYDFKQRIHVCLKVKEHVRQFFIL